MNRSSTSRASGFDSARARSRSCPAARAAASLGAGAPSSFCRGSVMQTSPREKGRETVARRLFTPAGTALDGAEQALDGVRPPDGFFLRPWFAYGDQQDGGLFEADTVDHAEPVPAAWELGGDLLRLRADEPLPLGPRHAARRVRAHAGLPVRVPALALPGWLLVRLLGGLHFSQPRNVGPRGSRRRSSAD